jgi:hypothetical protein
MVELPCEMTRGSRVTVVARLQGERWGSSVAVLLKLLGTKLVRGEELPRILHFNPRIRGDFMGCLIIELSTCYRMQWALWPQRCEGWDSRSNDGTGDLHCLFSFVKNFKRMPLVMSLCSYVPLVVIFAQFYPWTIEELKGETEQKSRLRAKLSKNRDC